MTSKFLQTSASAFIFLLLLCCSNLMVAQNIVSYACSNPGNGMPATAIGLGISTCVAVDVSGNMYVAESLYHRIRKINTSGTIIPFAGTGNNAFGGDGGAATAADISFANAIIADNSGNIYFTDAYNDRIRKINSAGIITTVAGNGSWGTYGGDGGAATAADIYLPKGICLDAGGNLYIADQGNNVIRKVNTAGIITTVAGNGSYGYSGDGGAATAAMLGNPSHICFDASGNMYIADAGNVRIRKVSTSGIITTIAGTGSYGYSGDGGPASAAVTGMPYATIADGSGNLYFSDYGNDVIRKIVLSTGIITTIAGNNVVGYSGDGVAATATKLNYVEGMAVDASGNLLLADTYNSRIRKVAPSGIITTVAGGNPGNGLPAASASFLLMDDLASDGYGNMYVVSESYHEAWKISSSGIVTNLAGNSTPAYAGDGGPATAASLFNPASVAADKYGNVFIADQGNKVGRKINAAGIISTFSGKGTSRYSGDGSAATAANLTNVTGVAVDTAGNLYLADADNNVVRMVNTSGIITTFAGSSTSCGSGSCGDGGPATAANLNYPRKVACDRRGNVYIADEFNMLVRKVDASGIITTFAGTGISGYSGDGGPATAAALGTVVSVHADRYNNIYIGDYLASAVRRVDTTGIISTIAGNGTMGDSGDGGPATAAKISYPYGICTDLLGNVYFADYLNLRIREVIMCPVPVAGTISGAASVCAGGTVTLSASGSWGGTWTTSAPSIASVSGGVIYGNSVGSATIAYTVGSSCGTATAVRSISVVHCTTGVSNTDVISGIPIISPNPNAGNFTINLLSADITYTITITDLLGRIVDRSPVIAGTTKMDVSLASCVNGSYFVKVAGDDGHQYVYRVAIIR